MVQSAEATQCQSTQECQNFSCAVGQVYCVDGECKCIDTLKADATTCQSNQECQNVFEQKSCAFCVDGKCNCT